MGNTNCYLYSRFFVTMRAASLPGVPNRSNVVLRRPQMNVNAISLDLVEEVAVAVLTGMIFLSVPLLILLG
jgi:hypothetical protein